MKSDWDSHGHHQKFQKSPNYGAFNKHLFTIIDGSIDMFHVNFVPHPPLSNVLSSITEVITCYFETHDPEYDGNVNKLVDAMKEKAEGFKTASKGWVIEDVEHEKIGSGKKGKAFVIVFGWDSVEAHMKFRETQAFKDNVHCLREGSLARAVHHTAFIES